MVEAIQKKPDLLLCPAAGNTPIGAYKLLEHYKDQVDFSKVRVVQLDEWAGIDRDDPSACSRQIREQLIEPLGISTFIEFASNETGLDSVKSFLDANGPIDLCILGLGLNGHLGFNEPAPYLHPDVHMTTLSETSKTHDMVKNKARSPEQGMTLGMGTILQSRQILLLVSGDHKKSILEEIKQKKVRTSLPASFLWLHQNVSCWSDRMANGVKS